MVEPWFTIRLRDESLRTPEVDAWLAGVQRRLIEHVPDPIDAVRQSLERGFKVPLHSEEDGA